MFNIKPKSISVRGGGVRTALVRNVGIIGRRSEGGTPPPDPPEPTYNTITSADGYILCDVNGIIVSPKTT